MSEKSRDARPNEARDAEGSPQSEQYAGKSVEEAVAKAAEALGIPPSELDYEVVKDSSHSLFGLMRKSEAVIRVWLPTEVQELDDAAGPAEEPTASGEQPDEGPVQAAAKVAGLARHLDEEDPDSATQKGNPPELEQVATEVLATLIDKMGLIAAVEVVEQGGAFDPASKEVSPMVLNAVGDDLGILIGRRGETLRDVQFITRLIISRKLGVWPNVIVDVESYKAKRVTSLQALATRMADEVRRTRRMVALEPMPAHERRIIHLALRDDPDVYTESTGVDEERKVQILPR